MMERKNYKYLVAGHLVALLIFGILCFFNAAARQVLLLMIVLVVVSLVIQVSIYKVKRDAFDDKVTKHPGAANPAKATK